MRLIHTHSSTCRPVHFPPVLLAGTFATLALAALVESSPIDTTRAAHPSNEQHMILLRALVIVVLNLIHAPCVYVAYETIKQWRENGCGMNARMPLYIALSDSFVAICITSSAIYTAVESDPRICATLTTLTTVALLLNLFLVMSVIWSTYVRICRDTHLNFGKYDSKLLVGLLGVAALLSMLGGCGTEIEYGDDDEESRKPEAQILWCTSSMTTIAPSVMSLSISFQAVTAALLAVLLMTFYCYWRIYHCMFHQVDRALLGANMSRRRLALEARVSRKVNMYLSMFLSKWAIIFAYMLGKAGLILQELVIVLVLISAILCATLNTIQFSSDAFYRKLHEHHTAGRRFCRDDNENDDTSRTGEADSLCTSSESERTAAGETSAGPLMTQTSAPVSPNAYRLANSSESQ